MGLRTRASRLPLRLRLLAGFLGAMTVLLSVAGAFVAWRVEYALDRQLDAELSHATAVLVPLVDPAGTVRDRAAGEATGAGWQVIAPDGTVLDSGGALPDRQLVDAAQVARASRGTSTVEIGDLLRPGSSTARARLTPIPGVDGAGDVLLVAVDREARDEALRELVGQLVLAGLVSLLVAGVVGDVLARAALRPVERYRQRADEIAAGARSLRLDVPTDRDDEVTRLGHTLNDMLGELERALERERRFVDEASHELRTPVALLLGRVQLARRRTRSVSEHEQVLGDLQVDLNRLADLAESLLRSGAAGPVDLERVDLADQVRAWSTGRSGLREPGVEIRAREGATVDVLPGWLDRVLDNLTGNAALHGAPPVVVSAHAAGPWSVLAVADGGEGIDPDLLPRVTDRFTRAAEARSRPGAGLGLALIEKGVLDRGGQLRVCSRGRHHHVPPEHPAGRAVPCGAAEHGTTVTLVLPRAAAPAP